MSYPDYVLSREFTDEVRLALGIKRHPVVSKEFKAWLAGSALASCEHRNVGVKIDCSEMPAGEYQVNVTKGVCADCGAVVDLPPLA